MVAPGHKQGQGPRLGRRARFKVVKHAATLEGGTPECQSAGQCCFERAVADEATHERTSGERVERQIRIEPERRGARAYLREELTGRVDAGQGQPAMRRTTS